jgi:hypothetical protein
MLSEVFNMGIIYKVNKGGTLAWTIPKQMKAAGYVQGVKLEAIAAQGGFLLKIVPAPSEPIKEALPQPAEIKA